ncbi:unnamed protein product [Trichobilharzia regenti]|nr:unnamed protein product [Trichobilharzia regenti]
MHASDRLKHEEFTKRVGDSCIVEILCICILPIIMHWLRFLVCIRFQLKSKNRLFILTFMDYFFILIPLLLILTFFASYIIIITSICLIICLLWTLLPSVDRFQSPCELNSLSIDILVADLRSAIYIISCVMIYCIDLPICPRRFAKSELNGISLMDVGTGLFIVASGISGSKQTFQMNIHPNKPPGKDFIHCTLNSVAPCLILGLFRTLFVQMANYQQSITEYGIHWNFFYTVGIIRGISLMVTTKNTFSKYLLGYSIKRQLQFYFLLAGGFLFLSEFLPILLCHEYFKPRWQFNPVTLKFIDENRSTSLLMANFEGVISLPGYASLYFWALGASSLVRVYFYAASNNTSNKDTDVDTVTRRSLPKIRLRNLFLSCGLFVLGALMCIYMLNGFDMISRRFANVNYVFSIIFLKVTAFILCATMFSLLIKFKQNFLIHLVYSPLCLCVNSKGMMYFIASNLLTGFLNSVCFNTLNFLPEEGNLNYSTGTYDNLSWYSSILQFCILLAYTTLSAGFVFLLYYRNNLLKSDFYSK